MFDPSQVGRVCPIETPEGSNIGRILHVAVGAEIGGGRLIIRDPSPAAALGVGASMVPFLEHSDANRLLMGVNMMRQWLPAQTPEPALIQTGNEPAVEEVWCGRNLLTAFISWGGDTHEDGVVVSQSAAAKMDQGGRPLEVGDKISNRHGTAGVVSRILLDEEMPHLSDGTPVELIYSFIGLHTRLNFGQQREAVMSRIARAEGTRAIVPPFGAPSSEQILARLQKVGLDPSGMERLLSSRIGRPLDMHSLAGWIYWGKTRHLAADKIHCTVDRQRANMQGELEYLTLRGAGAFELIQETFNTRSASHPDAEALAGRIASGETITQVGLPSPQFADTVRNLKAAGIRAELSDGPEPRLSFHFAPPEPPVLRLAQPVPHPWAEERDLTEIGLLEDRPEGQSLRQVNDRLVRLQRQKAPSAMLEHAARQLREHLRAYLEALFPAPRQPDGALPPTDQTWTINHLARNNRVVFSGRTVLAPGRQRIDQLGLADEIAWTLYGPFVDRKLGLGVAATRSEQAAQTLDAIMAESWLLLNRAPSVLPTSILAFHPVRIPEKVIRLHPLANMLLNADYDGDQAAVFLPITDSSQREAGERLSIAGHLRRDPSLLRWLMPSHASLWGLARLSLSQAGRRRINNVLGLEVQTPDGFVTRAKLEEAARSLLQRESAERTLAALDELVWLGFEQACQSGASMSPFVGSKLTVPAAPRDDDPDSWNAYSGQIAATISSASDFDDPDLGPQVLAVRCGARGSLRHLVVLLGSPGAMAGLDGKPFICRSGWTAGLEPADMFTRAMHARRALGNIALSTVREAYGIRQTSLPEGLGVLARAMRADRPGVVFARAALSGEIDPLMDIDSRLFVGLPASMVGS